VLSGGARQVGRIRTSHRGAPGPGSADRGVAGPDPHHRSRASESPRGDGDLRCDRGTRGHGCAAAAAV